MAAVLNANREGLTGIYYGGVELSQTFVVADFNSQLLPTLSSSVQTLAGRPGAYFERQKITTRQIDLKLRLNAGTRDPVEIFKTWRDYSNLIYFSSPQKMYLNEYKYCYAILEGKPDVKSEAYYGTVDAKFVCYDPFFYGILNEVELVDSTAASFTVEGNISTYPSFELTATDTNVSVINWPTSEYVYIPNVTVGDSIVVDNEKRVVTVNGTYKPVYLLSSFFAIKNNAAITVRGAEGKLSYRGRWL